MSKSVNSVTILGNVGKDPEIRSTGGGTSVASFSIATSYKAKDREEVRLMGLPAVDAAAQPHRYRRATMTTPSEDYRLIPLTQGQFAKVSAHRFEEINSFKWMANWSIHTKSFYAKRNRKPDDRGIRGSISMARVVLGLPDGDKRHADHINHDTLDNRDENLRIATNSENTRNRRFRQINNAGLKGVRVLPNRKNGYQARITVDGKILNLGVFDSAEKAHKAYCEAAAIHHGQFANTESFQ